MHFKEVRDAAQIGFQIRLARKKRGWLQSDLAALSGTDARQISRIETAAYEPKLSILMGVISALDLDLAIIKRQGSSPETARKKPEDIF